MPSSLHGRQSAGLYSQDVLKPPHCMHQHVLKPPGELDASMVLLVV
jgi:hypothetical protein